MKLWNQAYRDRKHEAYWDCERPSAELVAFIGTGVIQDGAMVLDIGCGAGTEAIYLARCGHSVVGLDVSREALKLAEERSREAGVHVSWVEGNALDLPVADVSIRFANDRGCFHHIGKAERERYAEEVRRVLQPGGSLLLRGCRCEDFETGLEPGMKFVPVTQSAIDEVFREEYFTHSPVQEVSVASDTGMMPGNLVVIKKTR